MNMISRIARHFTSSRQAETIDGKKDFFGYEGQATLYRKFRPRYPASLLEYVDKKCVTKELAVDIACGSGQLTLALAQDLETGKSDATNESNYGLGFENVIGIDQSAEQISKAMRCSNLTYHCMNGLDIDSNIIKSNSCDLVTVAQGLHWFMNENDNSLHTVNQLYNQIERILKPKTGIFAVLGYGSLNVQDYPQFQACFDHYYYDILGSHKFNSNKNDNGNSGKTICCYWEFDCKLLDDAFNDCYFSPPFDDSTFERKHFIDKKEMDETQLFGYLESFSGYQTYVSKNSNNNEYQDPLNQLKDTFRNEMTERNQTKMIVNFPFFALTMKK